MLLYLDTSALVKIYVREAGREIVAEAIGESIGVATAMISYVEARAAFARLLRESRMTEEDHDNVTNALDERWFTYVKPPVNEDLIQLAGNIAQRHALRGYDSVQLASALVCDNEHQNLRFLAFDENLKKAAGQVVKLY